jgi:hypothetical protein
VIPSNTLSATRLKILLNRPIHLSGFSIDAYYSLASPGNTSTCCAVDSYTRNP